MDDRRTTELEDFLRSFRSERRLAPLTCSVYERDVSACLGYLQGEGIQDLAEVKVTNLGALLAEEQKRRPAMSSQPRTTAALKSFFRFLVDEERLVRDPALPLRTPGKQEALPDVLTMGELSDCSPSPAATSSGSATFHGKAGRDRLLLA
jgi:site-specific recombinase XerD